ncbi:hypothetical protein BHF68_10745 [Desulfuribacillus alkaliarsenatis]|uniref:Methyltransferase small domain-containing protein n=1 Tax=Desulfuribacillus alkaliarsenatis TaxID=766136 RepID=A0A1E5FZK5_9FIRM|nr:hypothetical protein BHF68_10745 [Desulfuribacillus alkaliarsenatis]
MIILIIVIFTAASLIYYTLTLGISPVPSGNKVRQKLFKTVQRHIVQHHTNQKHIRAHHITATPTIKVAELGAGWGTLAFPLAKQLPQATIYAYEASLIPYLFMKLRLLVSPQQNLILLRQNFYNCSLADYDVFICYLYPKAMKKLQSKFELELEKPAIIFTHTFAIPDWKANEIIQINDIHQTKIYIYKSKT